MSTYVSCVSKVEKQDGQAGHMIFHVPGPLYSFILFTDSGYMTLNFPGGSDVKNLPAMQET